MEQDQIEKQVVKHFDLRGDFVSVEPYGSGRINDTYLLTTDLRGECVRYILQRLNSKVFSNPENVMENIEVVTKHFLKLLSESGVSEVKRRTLTLIRTRDEKAFHRDENDGVWRMYPFIERSCAYDSVDNERICGEAAKAFARFQYYGSFLEAKSLHITIPDFHNTPMRIESMFAAISEDSHKRVASAGEEIEWFKGLKFDFTVIENLLRSGDIPIRVVHNDTKINNVLMDDVTQEGVCVIDLDTTMPGCVLHDFGDMVRSASASTPGVDGIEMRFEVYQEMLRGFLEKARGFLTDEEVKLLPYSCQLLTVELAARYLQDYLKGDVYFKVDGPTDNLMRARRQMALADSMDEQMDRMEAELAEILSSGFTSVH